MASTAPPLRRSKRKQAPVETIAQSPTEVEAQAPRKRARRTPAPTAQPVIKEDVASKKRSNANAKVKESSEQPSAARLQQINQPLPPFLALPRELRDEIYRHVLNQEEGSTKLKSGSRNIVTRCGLVGVNSQICEEFIDAVLFYAPVITTTVKNHNFAHVVTFLNRLSQAQLNRLSSRGPGAAADKGEKAKSKRKILITLSYSAGAKDSRQHLNRWLDRFDVPEKRGKEIEFDYVGDGTYVNGGYKQRPRVRSTASKRWNEEAHKIGEMARKANRRYYGLY